MRGYDHFAWRTFTHEVYKALLIPRIVEWLSRKLYPKQKPHTHNFKDSKIVMRGGDAFKDTAFIVCECECGQQAVWQYGLGKPKEWIPIK